MYSVVVLVYFLCVCAGFFCLCVFFGLVCFFYNVYVWFGDHGGGVTPGLVSIPEVKSSCVFDCTAGVPVGSLQRCRPSHYYNYHYCLTFDN